MSLEECCLKLVKFKDSFDESLTSEDEDPTCPLTDHFRSIFPTDFIEFSMPFSMEKTIRGRTSEAINPNLVIAGNYPGWDPLEDGEEIELMDRLDGHVTNENGYDTETQRSVKIGNLPLYAAQEGRHRVCVYRINNRTMWSNVQQSFYPAAEDLTIIRFKFTKNYALKYNNRVKIIIFPDVVIPILNHYGVTKKETRLWCICDWDKKKQLISFLTIRSKIKIIIKSLRMRQMRHNHIDPARPQF